MKITYKTAKGLTTEYIKTIKSAEASNAQYLVSLAKLAQVGKASYNDLETVNKALNSAFKDEGISTFKNVASIVGRMYNKKVIDKKSVAFEVDLHVIEGIIALGDNASMSKLQNVRKQGKVKQTKAKAAVAKPITNNRKDVVVDVKKEIESRKDKIINVARETVKLSKDELRDKYYDLVTELESLSMNFDPLKDTNKTATLIAKMQDMALSY